MLTALARILFLADLALDSLKRSKSLRPFLKRLASARLAQPLDDHLLLISSASQALRTYITNENVIVTQEVKIQSQAPNQIPT